MNRIKTLVATLGIAAVAIPSVASAAPGQSINARQAQVERSIEQGIRSGALDRREASRLRNDYRSIVNLEARYRRSNGLSNWERRDLNKRFDALAAKIRVEKRDRQHRRG